MNDYYYEYYIKLDDGSYLSYTGESTDQIEPHDRRAFFRTRPLAHVAGEGFAKIVKDESNIEITYTIESIVRYP